jgi:hypothetical protein
MIFSYRANRGKPIARSRVRFNSERASVISGVSPNAGARII